MPASFLGSTQALQARVSAPRGSNVRILINHGAGTRHEMYRIEFSQVQLNVQGKMATVMRRTVKQTAQAPPNAWYGPGERSRCIIRDTRNSMCAAAIFCSLYSLIDTLDVLIATAALPPTTFRRSHGAPVSQCDRS